jgi:hypothetical protein
MRADDPNGSPAILTQLQLIPHLWRGLTPRTTAGPKTPGGGTVCDRRSWLSGDALIKLEVGCGLAEKVPGRHRLRHITPGGWSAGGALGD